MLVTSLNICINIENIKFNPSDEPKTKGDTNNIYGQLLDFPLLHTMDNTTISAFHDTKFDINTTVKELLIKYWWKNGNVKTKI